MTPSPCHGLRGVGAEVHDHLLQPARLAQHDGILVRQAHPKGDRRGQRGAQQAGGLLEQGAHAHRTVPLLGAAAEGEDPIDDVPRTLARLPHLLHMPPFPAVATQPAERHLGVAEDRPEDVVEVMRDAAGQRAERLDALGMPQPQFEGLLLPLGLLAAERAGKDLTDRAQQRDVVVCPALLGLDRIEAQEADAISCVPQRNAEPGADAALRQPRFLLASWQCLNGGNVDAAMTLIALGTPGRSDRQRAVRPAIGCIDSFAAPTDGIRRPLHHRRCGGRHRRDPRPCGGRACHGMGLDDVPGLRSLPSASQAGACAVARRFQRLLEPGFIATGGSRPGPVADRAEVRGPSPLRSLAGQGAAKAASSNRR